MTTMIGQEPLVTSQDWRACSQTLYREAELLDRGRYREWLDFVAPEIDYRILIRTASARDSGVAECNPMHFHLRCARSGLETRVRRVETGWAFSEDPPATTRRFVSNIRPVRSGDELRVKSNILMFRARWESSAFISAERDDVWREVEGRLLLAQRWIYLDHTSVPVENLGAFF